MKKTVVVSDISGDEINKTNAATVTVSIDSEDYTWQLDVTAAEAKELGSKGTRKNRLGRKRASVKAGSNGTKTKSRSADGNPTDAEEAELVGAGAADDS